MGVLFLLLVVGAYNYRLHKIAGEMSARFDERLAERTRLARELHDTFLQTIQGSKLVAKNALANSSDPIRVRRALEQLSEWLEMATHEGRAALNSLRTSTTEKNDLAEALRRAIEECRTQNSIAGSFSVGGAAKDMHPVVRDEVYRIGYEAIRNACMHSGGTRLDVVLTYAKDLIVRVTDDGIGIDPAVAAKGKDGHYGLQGMRERTARIGGKFTLVSSATSGTEVQVVVPGNIIFRATSLARRALLTKLRAILKRADSRSPIGLNDLTLAGRAILQLAGSEKTRAALLDSNSWQSVQ